MSDSSTRVVKRPGPAMQQTDLSRELGVSQMTISRVLNNQPGVSLALRRQILAKLKQVGYVRDRLATGLRGYPMPIIGLIVPDIRISFFPEIAAAIEQCAMVEDFRVVLGHSHEDYVLECQHIDALLGLRIAGFIIAPTGTQNDVDVYRKLRARRIPFVFLDRIKRKVACDSVVTDTQNGARELGRYLARRGYRRWGYLKGPRGVSSSAEHEAGLRASLREAGLSPSTMIPIPTGFREEDGYRMAGDLLRGRRPDVIVAVNDSVAVGAYRALKERGLRVPRDVALAGFSDLDWTGLLAMPLTTVREPTAEIGRRAWALLMRRQRNPAEPVLHERLAPVLVARASA